MRRWLSFIFLMLTAFSAPAITRQFAPVISDERGNVLAEVTNVGTGYFFNMQDLQGVPINTVK